MPRATGRNAWTAKQSKRRVRWEQRPSRPTSFANGLDDPRWDARGSVGNNKEEEAPDLDEKMPDLATCDKRDEEEKPRSRTDFLAELRRKVLRDSAAAGACPEGEAEAEVAGPTLLEKEAKLSRAATWRVVLVMRAARLWTCDYTHLLELERLEKPVLRDKVLTLAMNQISTYRARLKDAAQIARYNDKTERVIRDQTAVLRRRANQLDIPFSVDARTMSYMNQRVATRVWKDMQHGLLILHRSSAQKVLETMVEVQPAPPFVVNEHVACFGVDQCNHWQAAQHSKKGEFRGAERLNKLGMPIVIRSETVLNVVQRFLPFTAPMLTAQEVQLIQDKGPYTEDPNNVFAALNPQLLEKELWAWVAVMLSLLMPDVLPPLLPKLPESEEEVVERILGKPSIKPTGRSEYRIHPPIPKCETQSYEDTSKMMKFLSALVSVHCVCIIIFCDGQLVELLRSCLMNHPAQYKRVIAANGHFHAFVHFLFCGNTGYWPCCCCTFSRWQGKRKQIYQHMKDLQHDNARHVLDFHRTNVAGILSYLILDVTNPSPVLLLRDPRGYLALVNVGGGIVILQYLFRFGLVALFWQRAMRECCGKAVTSCLAYAFHFHRAYVRVP